MKLLCQGIALLRGSVDLASRLYVMVYSEQPHEWYLY